MPENVIPGPVSESASIREATCIHTKKIYDSCQAKDCVEDLRLYPTAGSQAILDNAQSVRAGRAELLYVHIQVDPVGFNRGFYSVNLRFFYRITAEAYACNCCRPCTITGLAVFDKRCMLFGSQGTAKIFSSECSCNASQCLTFEDNLPTAILEAVDPMVLDLKLVDLSCQCKPSCECPVSDIPAAILNAFEDTISFGDSAQKRVLLTLGQFSILRMERDSQLLIPVYDYCMPEKECRCDSPVEDDPCQLFQRVDFPVGEFFPPAAAEEIDPMTRLRKSCSYE